MKHSRRMFLHLAVRAVALPLLPRMVWSLDYPTRPVRVLVGFSAGSGPDVIARLIGQRLSDRLGRQFIIDNRSGAGSSLAAQEIVAARADGYALCSPPTQMPSTPAFIRTCPSISCATSRPSA